MLERWNDDANLTRLAALILLTALLLTLKMQSDIEIDVANELPSKFPGRNTHLFPNPWRYKDRSGKGMTPPRDSDEWKAIIDFKESRDWETGDLTKFANYFGVGLSALSLKISASMEERRRERVFKFPIQEHSRDDAELQGQGAPLPQNHPPLCWRRLTPLNPGAADGSMQRANGAPDLSAALHMLCDAAELPPEGAVTA